MINPQETDDRIMHAGEIKYAPENYDAWDSWAVEKDGIYYLCIGRSRMKFSMQMISKADTWLIFTKD